MGYYVRSHYLIFVYMAVPSRGEVWGASGCREFGTVMSLPLLSFSLSISHHNLASSFCPLFDRCRLTLFRFLHLRAGLGSLFRLVTATCCYVYLSCANRLFSLFAYSFARGDSWGSIDILLRLLFCALFCLSLHIPLFVYISIFSSLARNVSISA